MRRNYRRKQTRHSNRPVANQTAVVRPSEILSATDMELENFLADGILTKMIIFGVLLSGLASLALISASTQITLNKTRQDIQALSTQFEQHLERNEGITAVKIESNKMQRDS